MDAEAVSEPSSTHEIRIAAWKQARRDYAAVQRRMWLTGLMLGPLTFLGLLMLSLAQCARPIDFASLGGASMAMFLLWTYFGERGQSERERAGNELRAAEAALGQRAIMLESGSADRMVRLILGIVLILLWGWNWTVRPDCTAPGDPEADLTAFNVQP